LLVIIYNYTRTNDARTHERQAYS